MHFSGHHRRCPRGLKIHVRVDMNLVNWQVHPSEPMPNWKPDHCCLSTKRADQILEKYWQSTPPLNIDKKYRIFTRGVIHKEGPDTRWATAVLILVILLRCRSMATSALFGLRSMGRTSRFWYSPPLHVSIWLYHRRFRPRVRVSVTKTSCWTIAVSLHGSKVKKQGLSGF